MFNMSDKFPQRKISLRKYFLSGWFKRWVQLMWTVRPYPGEHPVACPCTWPDLEIGKEQNKSEDFWLPQFFFERKTSTIKRQEVEDCNKYRFFKGIFQL